MKVKLLSVEEMFDQLENHMKAYDTYESHLLIMAALESNIREAARNQKEVEKLYNFATNSPKVQEKEAVISGTILPAGYTGTLYDFKIKARGPDDTAYRKSAELREKVTRGMAFFELKEGKKVAKDLVIYANKKFTGGAEDEDDVCLESDDAWRQYCLDSPESAVHIASTEKLNGEAAHFAARYIGSEFFVFTGSKNVHMCVGSEEHIAAYDGLRYEVARGVAKAVLQALQHMAPAECAVLLSLLHHTKVTVVCELLQPGYQHIVDLSHLTEAEVRVVAMTPTVGHQSRESFTAIAPHCTLDLATALGLRAATYVLLQPHELTQHKAKIRKSKESEGAVLHYLDSSHRTIGLFKLKSAWYILLRALREKVVTCFCSRDVKPVGEKIKATHKRFREIQRWLGFGNAYREHWENLASKFFPWVKNEMEKNSLKKQDIRPKFPQVWKCFLQSSKLKDDFPYE